MSKLLSCAANAQANLTLTQDRPQYLVLKLTGTDNKINVTGNTNGMLVDLDNDGIISLGQLQNLKQATSHYFVPLGIGRDVETINISLTCGNASGIDLYGYSMVRAIGSNPICSLTFQQNANTSQSYSKFYCMGFANGNGKTYSALTAGEINVQLTDDEITAIMQSQVNAAGAGLNIINNYAQTYKEFTINTGANQLKVYKQFLKL